MKRSLLLALTFAASVGIANNAVAGFDLSADKINNAAADAQQVTNQATDTASKAVTTASDTATAAKDQAQKTAADTKQQADDTKDATKSAVKMLLQ